MIWDIDPVLLNLGPLQIHWYGVFFATAILSGFQLMKWIYKNDGRSTESLDSLFIYVVVGVIVGARLGHCLFYDPVYYLSNPLKILAIREGGLASHGGGLGAILAVMLYQKKHKEEFLWVLDRLTLPTALFGFFVRMGNFMNSEILGKPSDVSWAITFSRIDNLPRHPTQLYESISYLLIFFVMLILYKTQKIKERTGVLLGAFLCLVFSTRFAIELVKEAQATWSAGIPLNTGQLLSIPFLCVGLFLVVRSIGKPENVAK
ncbi:prolipoprotein diacylglyceryl transferase [Aurantivibrio infirmus]